MLLNKYLTKFFIINSKIIPNKTVNSLFPGNIMLLYNETIKLA